MSRMSLARGTFALVILSGLALAPAAQARTIPPSAAILSPTASVRSGVPASDDPVMTASDLRATLNRILEEHIYLALSATGAAVDGRQADFTAAAAALDKNSVALSQAIGAAYGESAASSFLALWRSHIGMFVDYTTAAANGDKAAMQKAVNALMDYVQTFATFLSGANPNLPKATVASLVKSHVLGLKAVVDAQVAKDPARAYAGMRQAAEHVQMIADPLAAAIAQQFPDRFPAR